MGKNLRGKELGTGLSQRKDGRYSARYVSNGKRIEKYFNTPQEAKRWLEDKRYEERHADDLEQSTIMTVDQWFQTWFETIIFDLTDVKPYHCKKVLKEMDCGYAGSTIRQTYIAMGTMFRSAVMNDIIEKHPMNGVRYTKPIKAVDDIHFLTVEEQKTFCRLL